MDLALSAIAEPRRRQILDLVRDSEMSAGGIASHFDISRPAVSQHLRVLKGAGLLEERRVGTFRIYRLRPEGLAELRLYLEGFWDDGLNRLKAVVEHDQRTPDGGW